MVGEVSVILGTFCICDDILPVQQLEVACFFISFSLNPIIMS